MTRREQPGLILAFRRVHKNDGIFWFSVRIAFLIGLWGLLLWFLVYLIKVHGKPAYMGFLFVFCMFFISFLNCFVLRKRRRRDLTKTILRYVAFLPLWLLFSPAQQMCSSINRLISKVVAFQKPRYQSTNPALCCVCNDILSKSGLLTGSSWIFNATAASESHSHYPLFELRRSATNCHFCALLLASLVEEQEMKLASCNDCNDVDVEAAIPSSASAKKLTLEVWKRKLKKQNGHLLQMKIQGHGILQSKALEVDDNLNSQPNAQATRATATANESVTPEASLTTNFDSISTLIKMWIKECSKHKLCQSNFKAQPPLPFAPQRLLEIDNSSPPAIKLVEASEIPHANGAIRPQFVAFSHCWGNANIVKLLTENVDSFKERILFEELPLNFQDAVLITRQIGFNYLWIDSLCIMQDSSDDWNTEAPKMGLIFADAVCTLSASAAQNPFGGCFSKKNPYEGDCPVRSEGQSTLLVRSALREEDALERLFQKHVEIAPVSTRAWTFQERILANRVVHFCKGFVFFECNTLRASEYHERGVKYSRRANIRNDGKLHSSAVLERLEKEDDHFVQKTITRKKRVNASTKPITRPRWVTKTIVETIVDENASYTSRLLKKQNLLEVSALSGMRGSFQLVVRSSGNDWAEKMEFHQSWFEMIEQYSTRNLTQHTDKLMALAGVASFIQARSHRMFLAGLWGSVLPLNLLWIRDEQTPLSQRPTRNLPTWSWASVDGRISHRLKTEASPPNSSSVLKATKTVSKVGAREIFQTTWTEINPLVSVKKCRPTLRHNNLVHNGLLKLSLSHPMIELEEVNVNCIFDIEIDRSTTKLFGLAVLSFRNVRVRPFDSNIQLHGIILVKGDEEYCYERVGYFWSADEVVINTITTNIQDDIDENTIWIS